MASLGNGINTAAVYTKGGGTQLLALDGIQSLKWGRARKAISGGQVILGAADSKCWGELGDVHAWAHELVFFRDGERVWEGPIRRIGFKRGIAQVDAYDVLGWLTKRKNRDGRQLPEGSESPVTTEGDLVLQRAFALDDPNVLAWRETLSTDGAVSVARDVAPNTVKYADDLNSLAGQGLGFTTIGRRILLFPDHFPIGRTETLIPERDMLADVEVVEDGDDLATTATAVDTNGLSATSLATSITGDVNVITGVSAFYGLHDALVDAGDAIGAASLQAITRAVVANQYPAPILINVPADATLNCDAPIAMSSLVGGILVPVETSVTPRTVSASLILDSLGVAQDSAGEKVNITLAQPSGLAVG